MVIAKTLNVRQLYIYFKMVCYSTFSVFYYSFSVCSFPTSSCQSFALVPPKVHYIILLSEVGLLFLPELIKSEKVLKNKLQSPRHWDFKLNLRGRDRGHNNGTAAQYFWNLFCLDKVCCALSVCSANRKKLSSKYRRQNKEYGSIVYLKSLNYTTHICICTENWWVLLFLSWKPVSIQVEMSALFFKLVVGRRYSLVEFSNTFLFIQLIFLLLYTKAVFPLVPNKVHNIIHLSELALFLHHRVNKKWKCFFSSFLQILDYLRNKHFSWVSFEKHFFCSDLGRSVKLHSETPLMLYPV